MSVVRSLSLFVLAAIAEIGGAWLVWQGVREHRGVAWIGAGIAALAAYGFVATLQHDPHFGRILAAYGGIFVAGSLAWGAVADGFRPDRFDLAGAAICLIGVAVIMWAPRLTPAAIRTARLALAPLAVADADEMVVVLGDAMMYRYTGGSPPNLDALRARYVWMAVGRSADGAELWFNWIVRLPPTGVAVGAMQATVGIDGSSADVAWEIGVPWQGQGFAAEAAAAVIEWLIAGGVAEVRACIHPDHAASSAVAARAGLLPTDEVVDGEVVWRSTRRSAVERDAERQHEA